MPPGWGRAGGILVADPKPAVPPGLDATTTDIKAPSTDKATTTPNPLKSLLTNTVGLLTADPRSTPCEREPLRGGGRWL